VNTATEILEKSLANGRSFPALKGRTKKLTLSSRSLVMKKISLIAGVVIGALGLFASANAVERQFAVRSTAEALEIIEAGVDWDGTTPITAEDQADRMNANVDVLRTQKGQRNTSGLLGLLLMGGGVAAVVVGPKLGRVS